MDNELILQLSAIMIYKCPVFDTSRICPRLVVKDDTTTVLILENKTTINKMQRRKLSIAKDLNNEESEVFYLSITTAKADYRL